MNKSLEHSFTALERQRKSLLTMLDGITQEQLTTYHNGKWSVAHVLSHIIMSEQLSVNYMKKKILGIQSFHDTGLWEEIKMIVLIISQRLPFKFKAPKVVTEHTVVYQTREEIEMAWAKTRQEMSQLLEQFQDDQLRRKIYRHPIAGMMNIVQSVNFFGEHITHHTPQIKNRLRHN